MEESKGKFKAGDTVFAKENPDVKLIVRRYISRIYYCTFVEEPKKKELVLFERELV